MNSPLRSYAMSTNVKDTPIVKLNPPRFEDGRPLLIAGLAGRYTAGILDDLPALWERFSVHIGRIPGQVGRVAYGVCSEMFNGLGSERTATAALAKPLSKMLP